ncbi:hypothetical protein ACFLY8_05115 [Halobacteriota archaeon]
MKGKILNLLILVAIIAVILVAWSSTKIVECPLRATSASPKEIPRATSASPINSPRPTATRTLPEGAPQIGIIKSISFDKDTYYAGDIITAILEVENIGGADITSEKVTINATCVRLDDFTANLYLKTLEEEEKMETYTMSFSEIIGPGQTKILSASFRTLSEIEYGGLEVSLAGDYEILLTLNIDGETTDAKELKLTLLGDDLEN